MTSSRRFGVGPKASAHGPIAVQRRGRPRPRYRQTILYADLGNTLI